VSLDVLINSVWSDVQLKANSLHVTILLGNSVKHYGAPHGGDAP